MRFLSNPSTDPYFNMAFDEYCLRKFGAEGPLFYLWRNRPSVIIGLNQNAYGEVNLDFLRQHGILLARRVTGGGAVYHDLQNLNYSIIGRGVSPEPIQERHLRRRQENIRLRTQGLARTGARPRHPDVRR